MLERLKALAKKKVSAPDIEKPLGRRVGSIGEIPGALVVFDPLQEGDGEIATRWPNSGSTLSG